ncbi:hypothetical protein R1flu_018219 [Riccia fluitans]|uniref:Bifunctional inhibitor/plant lipid transfer protein/seed storage helical domain-containing protein n=1 Tax=Riccia fluitans TaxID=41844 RepID=A0ABD1ZHH0_9MARC
MASEKTLLKVLTVMVFLVTDAIFARGEAVAPDTQCTNSLLSLINCESFLAGTVTSPTDTCCQGLGSLVKNSPLCLCGVLSGNPAFSTVNLTRALLLPKQCDIPIDESQCSAITAPPPNSSSIPDTHQSPPANANSGSPASLFNWPSLSVFVVAVVAGVILTVHI